MGFALLLTVVDALLPLKLLGDALIVCVDRIGGIRVIIDHFSESVDELPGNAVVAGNLVQCSNIPALLVEQQALFL